MLTLSSYAEVYPKLRPDLHEGTININRTVLASIIKAMGKGTKLADIHPRDADDWRLGIMDGRRPNTVTLYVSAAKSIFETAKRRGEIQINPFRELKAPSPSPDKDWADITRDDLASILEACPDASWMRLFALCRLAGLRQGEAIRLKWSHLSDCGTKLRIEPEERYHTVKHKRRWVPIEPGLREILADRSGGTCHPGYVCGMSRSNLHKQATDIIAKAGVPKFSKPFHTLRKCLESEWLAKYPAAEVCAWLGHSPTVAAKHYHRASESAMELVSNPG